MPWYLDLRLINWQINQLFVFFQEPLENSHGSPQELSIAIVMETTLAEVAGLARVEQK